MSYATQWQQWDSNSSHRNHSCLKPVKKQCLKPIQLFHDPFNNKNQTNDKGITTENCQVYSIVHIQFIDFKNAQIFQHHFKKDMTVACATMHTMLITDMQTVVIWPIWFLKVTEIRQPTYSI